MDDYEEREELRRLELANAKELEELEELRLHKLAVAREIARLEDENEFKLRGPAALSGNPDDWCDDDELDKQLDDLLNGLMRDPPGKPGGEARGADIAEQAQQRNARIRELYEKLIASGRPPRSIASLIAERLEMSPRTVRRHLTK